MFQKFLSTIFGSRNERILKSYRRQVAAINALEPRFEALSDDALRTTLPELKARHTAGSPLAALLPEVFAAVST